MTFAEAAELVIGVEGNVSDDPNDPGKLTKWGISSVYYPAVLDASFSRGDALVIYEKDFWGRFRCPEMPSGVDLIVFDCGVNQTQQAARILQRALGVTTDGVIGTGTLAAIAHADHAELINEVAARRAVAYAENPLVVSDGLGWYRRLMKIVAKAHQAIAA